MKIVYCLIFLSVATSMFAQHRISGYVFDKETGERLVGAYVDGGSNNITGTDKNGFFTLKSKPLIELKFSYVGYKTVVLPLHITYDTLVQVYLTPGELLNEIIVTAKRNLRQGKVSMNAQQLRSVPLIGAKSDVLKAMEIIPGVQMQQEGSSLLTVRGGDPGQNLYLLDGVPIIHVHHLGGFFSVFNPDIINSLEVYKSSFPSQFGGKLSSIIDISQREGDKNKYLGSLSIGLTDVAGIIEGPAFLKNSSFVLSARKTLIDGLMALSNLGSDSDNNFIYAYGFHDINGKLSWRPNTNNSFYLSLYQGDDYLQYWSKRKDGGKPQNKMKTVWGNWFASGRWIYSNSNSLVATQTVSYVKYRLLDEQSAVLYNDEERINLKNSILSSVEDLSYRSLWNYQLNNSVKLDFGGQFTYLRHHPNQVNRSTENNTFENRTVHSFETSLFAETSWHINRRMNGLVGLRATEFFNGSYRFFSPEPRIETNFSLTENIRLQVGYMHGAQFSHLLITDGNVLSNEIWLSADKELKPSQVDHFSLGIEADFNNQMYKAGVSIYDKQMKGLITTPDGYSTILGDATFKSKVETDGKGYSRGVEVLLSKIKGKFTGNIGYSYAYSKRKYANINNGKWFVPDFDRPHNLNVNLNYQWNEKLSLSVNFVLKSGAPYTPAIGRQYFVDPNADTDYYGESEYNEAFIYGKRNSERMKIYHRADIGLIYKRKNKRGNNTEWTFSIYNIYNRHNPNLYYYSADAKEGIVLDTFNGDKYLDKELYQVSFFTIIPAFSYKVYFDGHNWRNRKKRGDRKMKEYFKDWMKYEH